MVDNLIRVTVSKDYVDNIVQSMSEMLIVMDKNGNIKTTNKALLNRQGYQEKEIIGQSIEKITIWDEDTQKGLKQIIEKK